MPEDELGAEKGLAQQLNESRSNAEGDGGGSVGGGPQQQLSQEEVVVIIHREVLPETRRLVTDPFGNYVLQKIFERGTDIQRRELLEQLLPDIVQICRQMFGCRCDFPIKTTDFPIKTTNFPTKTTDFPIKTTDVPIKTTNFTTKTTDFLIKTTLSFASVIQRALETVNDPEQAMLVERLGNETVAMACVVDPNANHVLQKVIAVVPPDKVGAVRFHSRLKMLRWKMKI